VGLAYRVMSNIGYTRLREIVENVLASALINPDDVNVMMDRVALRT
jgi:hypothetical protein